jgi:hypothetical protein
MMALMRAALFGNERIAMMTWWDDYLDTLRAD